jgi:hypothetical protein
LWQVKQDLTATWQTLAGPLWKNGSVGAQLAFDISREISPVALSIHFEAGFSSFALAGIARSMIVGQRDIAPR